MAKSVCLGRGLLRKNCSFVGISARHAYLEFFPEANARRVGREPCNSTTGATKHCELLARRADKHCNTDNCYNHSCQYKPEEQNHPVSKIWARFALTLVEV